MMKLLIAGGMVLFALAGCSSATYNERFEEENRRDESSSSEKIEEENAKFNNIPEEIDVKDFPAGSFLSKYNEIKKIDNILTPREKILLEVMRFLETPYLYGGNDHKGIDCSAFTEQVFRNSVSVNLPRTARGQFDEGITIFSEDNLDFGDLVFFDTTPSSYPGHVGIYLGDKKFVHAGSSGGVMISSLDEDYFSKRYISAKRLDVFDDNNNFR